MAAQLTLPLFKLILVSLSREKLLLNLEVVFSHMSQEKSEGTDNVMAQSLTHSSKLSSSSHILDVTAQEAPSLSVCPSIFSATAHPTSNLAVVCHCGPKEVHG